MSVLHEQNWNLNHARSQQQTYVELTEFLSILLLGIINLKHHQYTTGAKVHLCTIITHTFVTAHELLMSFSKHTFSSQHIESWQFHEHVTGPDDWPASNAQVLMRCLHFCTGRLQKSILLGSLLLLLLAIVVSAVVIFYN